MGNKLDQIGAAIFVTVSIIAVIVSFFVLIYYMPN